MPTLGFKAFICLIVFTLISLASQSNCSQLLLGRTNSREVLNDALLDIMYVVLHDLSLFGLGDYQWLRMECHIFVIYRKW